MTVEGRQLLTHASTFEKRLICSHMFVFQKWCKACVLLDGLNRGLPRLGVSRTRGKILTDGSANDTHGSEKQMITSNEKRPLMPSVDF